MRNPPASAFNDEPAIALVIYQLIVDGAFFHLSNCLIVLVYHVALGEVVSVLGLCRVRIVFLPQIVKLARICLDLIQNRLCLVLGCGQCIAGQLVAVVIYILNQNGFACR